MVELDVVDCCTPEARESCCEPDERAGCCGETGSRCGCGQPAVDAEHAGGDPRDNLPGFGSPVRPT